VTGILWTALGILGGFGLAALGDMVSEEVRDRLDHVPHAILRLAARRLDPALRVTVYEDEWLPELTYILKGDAARPITRLVHGTRYAVSIFAKIGRITRHLNPALSGVTAPQNAIQISVERIIDPATGEARWVIANLSGRDLHNVEVHLDWPNGPGLSAP
jgi:hypothetical protein